MRSCFLLYYFLTYPSLVFSFFFNDTATTEIYTLSLHDALPISVGHFGAPHFTNRASPRRGSAAPARWGRGRCRASSRSEEHTSELQSRFDLVCRLLLEKKKQRTKSINA